MDIWESTCIFRKMRCEIESLPFFKEFLNMRKYRIQDLFFGEFLRVVWSLLLFFVIFQILIFVRVVRLLLMKWLWVPHRIHELVDRSRVLYDCIIWEWVRRVIWHERVLHITDLWRMHPTDPSRQYRVSSLVTCAPWLPTRDGVESGG